MSRIPNFADKPFRKIVKAADAGSQESWQTPEDIVVPPVYGAQDLEGLKHLDTWPGLPPFLRGPYPTMYVQQPWTVRQYAGFSTAEDSNALLLQEMCKSKVHRREPS